MRQNAAVIELAHFEVSMDRGFLPARDPLSSFPGLQDSPLEVLTRELPKLLAARRLRDYVDGHLVSGPDEQGRWNEDEYRAAARILSFTDIPKARTHQLVRAIEFVTRVAGPLFD